MSDRLESEQDIQREMEEYGISNDGDGRPDVLMSGPVLQVTALVLVLILIAGGLFLIF